MTALLGWLAAGVLWGTGFFLVAWLASATLLKRAHPSVRALLFALVLLKFAVPFGPSLGAASPIAARAIHPDARVVLDAIALGAAAPRLPQLAATLIVIAWALGVALLIAVRIGKQRSLTKRLADHREAPALLVARVQAMSERVGVPSPRVLQGALGPCVIGALRPVLVLPGQIDAADLDAMLVHELTHLRRRDPITRLFQSVVETLFFFWPVVRIASRALSLACEEACDLAVVEAQVTTPTHYAELLLALGLKRGPALAMAAQPTQLERRINMLLTETKPRSRWGILAAVALLGLTFGATADPVAPARRSPEQAEGKLDQALIQAVIRQHLSEIQTCYEALLFETPGAHGTFAMDWTINADGTMGARCIGQGTEMVNAFGVPIDVESMGNCVREPMSKWVFPKPEGGVVNVTYPFKFEPAQK